MWLIYLIVFIVLVALELLYFRIADRFNIIDKPNERSSHTRIVLRGGGVIFTVALWVWSFIFGFEYPWMLAGVTLAAGVSIVDDIRSQPATLRLVTHFVAFLLVFYEMGLLQWELWWVVPLALLVSVGGTNIYNFMDGINGITGGYSLALLVPLIIKNEELRMKSGEGFVEPSLLVVIGLSLLVFCLFNFRTRAKCFAGDVGSIGIAMVMVFLVGRLMLVTGDVTWIVLYLVYGCDGMMTIFHRMMLHENLSQAHRKHAYQLMANELKIPHVAVSTIYMVLQLVISLVAVVVIPDTLAAHWIYLGVTAAVAGAAYILFMRKYYHLHEKYLEEVRIKSEIE